VAAKATPEGRRSQSNGTKNGDPIAAQLNFRLEII
jgi:hypothetical protein